MRLAPDFGIVGYTDRWQYEPGDTVSLHLSADTACDARIRLHRFRQLVPEGGSLDIIADEISAAGSSCSVSPQRTVIGSWFEADLPQDAVSGGFTLAFMAMPTAFSPRGSGVASMNLGGLAI